jgi:hypothetical protein
MTRLFISLFFLLGFLPAPAQELIFEKPAHLYNLPSNETYQIMQDSKGYIWFSTETGLCRYNGQELKVYGEKEGIPEESCYGIAEDSKGTIYVVTSKNRLLKLVNEKFTELPVSKAFAQGMNKEATYVNALKISGDSLLFTSAVRFGAKINLKKNTLEPLMYQKPDLDVDVREFYGISIPIAVVRGGYQRAQRSVLTYNKEMPTFNIRYKVGKKTARCSVERDLKYPTKNRIHITYDTSGNRILSTANILVLLRKDLSVSSFRFKDMEVLKIFVDRNNGLWIGTRLHGVMYFPDAGNLSGKPVISLDGHSVSCITEDREGHIWCTTVDDGVYCCRNKNLRLMYESSSEKIKIPFQVKCVKDSTYVFTGSGLVLKSFKDRTDTLGFFPGGEYLTDLIFNGADWFLAAKSITRRFSYDLKKQTKVLFRDHQQSTATVRENQLLQLKNGRIFGVNNAGISEFSGNTYIPHWVDPDDNKVGLFEDRDTNLYLYTAEKIYKLDCSDPDNVTSREFASSFPNIRKIIADKQNRFWIITKAAGVYLLKDGKRDSIPLPQDKGPINYYDIYEDGYANMWLATNVGLQKISAYRDGFRQEWFDKAFGLPDADLRKVTGNSTEILASTAKALYKFPLNSSLKGHVASVPIYVSSVKVNGEEYVWSQKPELTYDQNTLEIKYDVLDYNDLSGNVRLAYQVSNYDESMHYSDNTTILLTKLPPGEFRLLVSVVDKEDHIISGTNELNITIHPPFWQEWPFIILASFCGLALTIYIVYLVLRRSRRKQEEKNRIGKMLSEYQMSALKAQMNPHFIFNCINSIQRYILTNKTSDAYDYLAKFSKLIRLVLNYSEDILITLEEELEICQLYIEMEQIRYEGFFSYEIICEENVKTDTATLPSLLLQPYIENAIWHGIMNLHKSREGYLKVHIGMKGEDLEITIEDNGVGREESAKMRNRDHKSKALGLNKKRMELVNIMNNSVNASVLIEDIPDAENTVQGTRVKITIPQIHRND